MRLRPERANHVWAYDFVEDRTRDGRKIRMLNVVDEYTRECLVIRVARELGTADVIDVLSDLFSVPPLPGGRPRAKAPATGRSQGNGAPTTVARPPGRVSPTSAMTSTRGRGAFVVSAADADIHRHWHSPARHVRDRLFGRVKPLRWEVLIKTFLRAKFGRDHRKLPAQFNLSA